jgi:NaMN:DMB phosphoribosyltransferase
MKSMCLSSDQFWKMPPIQPLDQTLEASWRAPIERKAKPPGHSECRGPRGAIGMMWHSSQPRAGRAVLLIFAGDHGLTGEGVSQCPSEVTAAMARTSLTGAQPPALFRRPRTSMFALLMRVLQSTFHRIQTLLTPNRAWHA